MEMLRSRHYEKCLDNQGTITKNPIYFSRLLSVNRPQFLWYVVRTAEVLQGRHRRLRRRDVHPQYRT